MSNKNIATMLSRIASCVDTMVLTRVEPRDRCATYEILGGACMTHKIQFVFKDDCATALQIAKDLAVEKKLPLVIFGSVYLAGEIFRLTNRSI